jgi:two-component system chemotaxis response regulator CheB
MRKLISDIIDREPEFTVVATAKTGAEALKLIPQWKPDAITMDLEMPEMNGIEALKWIMTNDPTPVIMLSGISEDGTRETIKALQFGAFDFIRKPNISSLDIDGVAEQLMERLKVAVTVKRHLPLLQLDQPNRKSEVKKLKEREIPPPHSRPKVNNPVSAKPGKRSLTEPADNLPAEPKLKPTKSVPPKNAEPVRKMAEPAGRKTESAGKAPETAAFRHIVAIGTSTGGPRALHEVLTSLPGNLPAPVLVVQHMPPKFTFSLAQRLDSFSELHISEAIQGERVLAGHVYIAPGGEHMELAKDAQGYFIRLTEDQVRGGHRPSVDVLFESLLPHKDLKRHVVIMTGMGSDGAQSMKALTDQGVQTAIAEAEETCIVYGMPRSAIERGAKAIALPLHDIAPRLVDAVMK